DVGHGELGLTARRRLAGSLRGRFDRAIVLPRSWKSALVPFLARIPRRVGFTGEQRLVLLNERRELGKTGLDASVQRLVSLGAGDSAALRSRKPGAPAQGAGAGCAPGHRNDAGRRIRPGQTVAAGLLSHLGQGAG